MLDSFRVIAERIREALKLRLCGCGFLRKGTQGLVECGHALEFALDFARFLDDRPFRLVEPLIERGGAFYQAARISEPGQFGLDFRQFAPAQRSFFEFFDLEAQEVRPLGALAHAVAVRT